MDDVERLADLIAAHDREPAVALATKIAPTDPVAAALAGAALAHETPSIHLASLLLLAGKPDRAFEAARPLLTHARARDPVMRRALAGILVAAGRSLEAVSFLASTTTEASIDLGGELDRLATAFHEAPSDDAPIQMIVSLCVNLGRWTGGLAALERCREGEPPTHIALALDLAALELMARIGGRFPPPGVDSPSDAIVQRIVAGATARPPMVRLAIARALTRAERFLDAGRVLDGITGRRVLTPHEHADVQYMCGLLAERDGYRTTAIERYIKAVDADPCHVDAAINATSLLLESEAPEASAQISTVLGAVAPQERGRSASLAFNEARHHHAAGRLDDARACLERALSLAASDEPVADLARRALDELAGADTPVSR